MRITPTFTPPTFTPPPAPTGEWCRYSNTVTIDGEADTQLCGRNATAVRTVASWGETESVPLCEFHAALHDEWARS